MKKSILDSSIYICYKDLLAEVFSLEVRVKRSYSVLVAVVLFLAAGGCNPFKSSAPIAGAPDYSLNGKEIHPPNQVLVQNPYDFPVKITWLGKEEGVALPAHGQRYILFVGMNEPGAIKTYKIMDKDQAGAELTYTVKNGGPFNGGKIYQIR